MIKFLLWAIIFIFCWPIALLIGVVWLALAWLMLMVRLIGWMAAARQ